VILVTDMHTGESRIRGEDEPETRATLCADSPGDEELVWRYELPLIAIRLWSVKAPSLWHRIVWRLLGLRITYHPPEKVQHE
jgi:hypothetical protein